MTPTQKWRDKNPEAYREGQRRWRRENPEKANRQHEKVEDLRRKFDLLKLERPCYDCGGTFPATAMDWDHRPGVEKSFSISRGIALLKPIPEIMDEIAKCDLVCACCHRIRTKSRQ